MTTNYLKIVLFVGCFVFHIAHAQLSLPNQPVYQTLGFRQEFNTFVWNYSFNTQKRLSSRSMVEITERFRSSMLELSSGEKWKDDQNFALSFRYALLKKVQILSRFNSVIYRDKQSGFNNDIQVHDGALGLLVTPQPGIRLQSYIGPKSDSRFEQQDNGWYYAFDAAADHIEWEEYDHSLRFVLGEDRFASRRNKDLNAGYKLKKRFAAGTIDSLHVYTWQRRRDNYTSVSGDIERFQENVSAIHNTLTYRVSSAVQLMWRTVISDKDVQVSSISADTLQKSRKRNDQSLNQDMSCRVDAGPVDGRLHFSYHALSQLYDVEKPAVNNPFSRRTAFITPDNKSERFYLSAKFNLRLSESDRVSAFFSSSRFQYDTPDTNNFDDRDELRLNSRLTYYHLFNKSLKLKLNIGVNLYHMVYIYGERSADNNWNRIFRLNPTVVYSAGKRFRLSQSFEVLANYVDYDYEEMDSAIRSFVFRKFAVYDSLTWRFSRQTSFSMDYRLQLEENGQMLWDKWSEKVISTRRNQWLHLFVHYTRGGVFTLSPGFTLYFRDQWRYQPDRFGNQSKTRVGTFASYGPILRIRYAPSAKLNLVIDAMRQAVDDKDKERYYFNNIDVKLNWFL